jgi:hypothetical protein
VLVESRTGQGWIGNRPSLSSLSAILWVGTMGFVVCGVQPVVLGALVLEHRLTNEGLGWASTMEFLTIGLGIACAAMWLRPRRLRMIAFVGALTTGLADLAMFHAHGNSILLNRAISGAGEALLIWITGCMVARSANPVRWSAIFVTLQGLAQLTFATLIPMTLMAGGGANGGFVGLAITAGLAILVIPLLPREMADLATKQQHQMSDLLTPSSILVLTSIFLIGAFSLGLFVYLAPVAFQAGLTPNQMSFVISAALVGANVGSGLAILVTRLSYYRIFVISVVVNAVVLVTLFVLPALPLFAFAAFLYGVLWLFFLPYQMPMAIDADPTRRVAVAVPGVQLLGAAAGPFLCSLVVTNTESRGALVVVGICFALAFAITTAMRTRRWVTGQPDAGFR